MANATEEELISLIQYPNAVVKATAFHGLVMKGNPQVARIMVDFSQTDETIHLVSGCIGEPMLLSEYCFTNVMWYKMPGGPPSPPPNSAIMKRQRLTENERQLVVTNIKKNKIKAQ